MILIKKKTDKKVKGTARPAATGAPGDEPRALESRLDELKDRLNETHHSGLEHVVLRPECEPEDTTG